MRDIVIRRPREEDVTELNKFFRIVITHTFIKEGIGNMLDDMEQEIRAKENYLRKDIASGGKDRHFLIALDENKIVGSIEYGPVSELINHCTDNALKDLLEVGTVFVHPDYQRQGIGNQMLAELYLTLKNQGIEQFCLDSGYSSAQKIWQKKFGEPDYLLKDHWGDGAHHMIWKIKVHKI
ncbi:GNAT family N-acetyltransferase [Neobacillus mesonae]|uniref:GNAT family N-acetyltransferase n=1 Tax=Neobacillus mesonae TaxID=1193713 RepID=UPI002E202CD3|nr:GNAT family N-acetyltransferase [Neobacillus mesonae]